MRVADEADQGGGGEQADAGNGAQGGDRGELGERAGSLSIVREALLEGGRLVEGALQRPASRR
ncbi:MAG: hypothetical protein U0802_05270 [Candidatus Binatia bacterium]